MSETRTALVTGASRGIGLAIAAGLAGAGYDVIGTATSDKGLDSIRAALDDSGRLRGALELNLTSRESIDSFLDALGDIDAVPLVVVNNAGITRDNLMLRMKQDEWDEVISANLSAVFTLTQKLVRPMLKARFGRIVNISSVVGTAGNAGQCNYAAAKAGLVGFTKSLAQEVANRNITVNAVAPGFIETDMTGKLTDEQKTGALAQVPMGRMGTADEIAAAVEFLVSDRAAYITGETLHVNGGMLMA